VNGKSPLPGRWSRGVKPPEPLAPGLQGYLFHPVSTQPITGSDITNPSYYRPRKWRLPKGKGTDCGCATVVPQACPYCPEKKTRKGGN
jgi:hypothetical protein